MHGPWPSCGGARAAPCSTDCTSVVLHGSVCRSYLPSAETFPLCFDEGEGKHKRLCLLSRSLPPSPSQWSFGGSRAATKMQKNTSLVLHALGALSRPRRARRCTERRHRCTAPTGDGGRGNSAIALQKNPPLRLHDGPRAGS